MTVQISSEQLVRVFIERTKELTPIINAVIVTRFDEAIEDARKIDKLLESGKDLPEEYSEDKAPFLGVPFTAKEAFAITGLFVAIASYLNYSVTRSVDGPYTAFVCSS